MTTVAYAHIQFTNDGTPVIIETRTKVEEIVLDHLAHNWDAAEINRQHLSLSLAAIHSALAYYYDHQAEMDKRIEQGIRQVQAIRSKPFGPSCLPPPLVSDSRPRDCYLDHHNWQSGRRPRIARQSLRPRGHAQPN